MNESNQEKLLLKISIQLDKMSDSLNELNIRINKIEGKTDDMHRFTPFVGWLEGVGRHMSRKWLWLRGVPEVPPSLTEYNSNNDTVSVDKHSDI